MVKNNYYFLRLLHLLPFSPILTLNFVSKENLTLNSVPISSYKFQPSVSFLNYQVQTKHKNHNQIQHSPPTMAETNTETQKQARLAILELANMISIPMSLHAVVRLNVADAIWESGANAPLSAAQILARVVPHGGGDAENLQRVLRMLASYGVFEEHIGDGERKYSLTDVGKTLVSDENGVSYGAYVLQHHQVSSFSELIQ